jgi:hypothetical protein
MWELTSYERLIIMARWMIILAIMLLILMMHRQVNHGALRSVLAPTQELGVGG